MPTLDRQLSLTEKAQIAVSRRLPQITGKIIQTVVYSIYAVVRFIGSLLKEAIGR